MKREDERAAGPKGSNSTTRCTLWLCLLFIFILYSLAGGFEEQMLNLLQFRVCCLLGGGMMKLASAWHTADVCICRHSHAFQPFR